MLSTTKQEVYDLLHPSNTQNKWNRVISSFLVVLIILNLIVTILETIEPFYQSNQILFTYFEIFSIIVFTLEYVLRLWTITCNVQYQQAFAGRVNYLFSFGAIIDLMAILPFYLPALLGYDFRFLRILRLFRFMRLFKLSRYLNASKIISSVFRSKKDELMFGLFMTVFLIIIASCIMYFVEHDHQPDKFSSIPETMWWSVATLTTVGYGDVFPITTLGKTLTAFISILGIGLFALPAGILASGFSEAFKKNKKSAPCCPHCGKEVE